MDYSSSNLILRQKNEEIKIVLPQVDEAPLGAVNMTLHIYSIIIRICMGI